MAAPVWLKGISERDRKHRRGITSLLTRDDNEKSIRVII